MARYTPEHLQAEFAAIGSAAALLFERILAAAEHREQAVRAGLGLLRLGGAHGAGRLEQACQAALEANVRSWRYVQRWLATGGPPPVHIRRSGRARQPARTLLLPELNKDPRP